jgi:hypothetical protein
MFGIFKRKSEVEQLQAKYQKVLKEAYNLSTSNRKLSDAKTAEANEILKQIENLQKTD